MKIYKGYKTELDPNNKQKTLLAKGSGTVRFVYNWGLEQITKVFETNKTLKAKIKVPTAIDLHKLLNSLKANEFPWMYDVSKWAPQEALRNLDVAFKNFFTKCKLKKAKKFKGKCGFPKLKTKKKGKGSFRLYNITKVTNNDIKLPNIGKIKLKEKGYLPTNTKIHSATVSEHAGRWFVSVLVEEETKEIPKKDQHDIIGVDLGVKTLATHSDGETDENPKALRNNLKKLRRFQRKWSRTTKGGKNREKVRKKVANLHYRVANIRKDALNQSTSKIAKTKRVVGIEDLNVAGMLKNHKLARAIADVGFGEWRRQLEYKASWYGCKVIAAPRFFPSSKTCNCCGFINKDLKLSEREWTCSECHAHHDRDMNAAINLEKFAISSMVTACEVS